MVPRNFFALTMQILSKTPLGDLKCDFADLANSVVAVHGLNGDAYTTWTSDEEKVLWLSHRDLLPKYLPKARVLTWGYNANVTSVKKRSTSADRILQHAQTLVAQLVADREVNHLSNVLVYPGE